MNSLLRIERYPTGIFTPGQRVELTCVTATFIVDDEKYRVSAREQDYAGNVSLNGKTLAVSPMTSEKTDERQRQRFCIAIEPGLGAIDIVDDFHPEAEALYQQGAILMLRGFDLRGQKHRLKLCVAKEIQRQLQKLITSHYSARACLQG